MGAALLLVLLGGSVSADASQSKWVIPQEVVGQLQSDLSVPLKDEDLVLQSLNVKQDTIEVSVGATPQGKATFSFIIERNDEGPALRLLTGDQAAFRSLKVRLGKLDLDALFLEIKEAPTRELPRAERRDGALERAVDVMKARLAGRMGHGPWFQEELPTEIAKLLDQLRTGGHDTVRTQAKHLLQSPNPPPGSYSLYLAAGGEEPANLQDALRRHPLEPRLHVLRAQHYLQAGERQMAAESLSVAMRLPLADAAARDEAQKLGLPVAESWPEALPGEVQTDSVDLSLAWFLLFGILAALMLVLSLRGRRFATASAILFGAAAAWLVIEPSEGFKATPIPDVLLAPLSGGACEGAPGRIDGHGYVVDALCPRGKTTLVVSSIEDSTKGEAWSFARTEYHQINLQDADARSASSDVQHAVALLKETLEVAEKAGFRAPKRAALNAHSGSLRDRWTLMPASARAELRIGAGVVLTAVLMLLLLGFQHIRSALMALRGETRWVWLLLAACLCLYLLVPSRMLMVYSGYDRVDALAQGELPRYGIASLFFYGPFLWFGGVDHSWLQAINRFLGLAALAVAWDIGRVLFRMDKRTSWLSAVLLVSMPLFVRGFTSEAISPFPTLCLLVALRILIQPTPRNLPAACALLICAAMGRPEIAAAVVLIPFWFFITFPVRTREEAPWLVFGALTLVVALQVARTLLVTDDLATREALPLASEPFGAAFHVLTFKSAHVSIDYTPLGFTPLLLIGAWFSSRRTAIALLGIAAVWLGATGIDLVRVSIPRLHLGPILLLTPLVAVGAIALIDKAQARGTNALRSVAGLLAALWITGLALNAHALFSPITEEGEETLWRDTVSALPSGPGCLLRYGFGDPVPSPKTPLYSPDYLLPNDWRTGALSDLKTIQKTCEGPVYLLLGTHCYTHLRPPDTPAPEGLAERALCTEIRQRNDLKPVLERDVPNVGEPPGLRLFPQAEVLPVGLYELGR